MPSCDSRTYRCSATRRGCWGSVTVPSADTSRGWYHALPPLGCGCCCPRSCCTCGRSGCSAVIIQSGRPTAVGKCRRPHCSARASSGEGSPPAAPPSGDGAGRRLMSAQAVPRRQSPARVVVASSRMPMGCSGRRRSRRRCSLCRSARRSMPTMPAGDGSGAAPGGCSVTWMNAPAATDPQSLTAVAAAPVSCSWWGGEARACRRTDLWVVGGDGGGGV